MIADSLSKTGSDINLPGFREFRIPPDAKEFLNDFIESTGSKLEELETAALACEKKDNFNENVAFVRRILHTIKGNAGIIGITGIYEFCHQSEFAIEKLEADKLPDTLLSIKDWLQTALHYLADNAVTGSQPNNKCLIVEDDFACRKLLQRYLSDYGNCDIAVNGIEAVNAFEDALRKERPYNLICLDIMMPQMDGHQTLDAIRRLEEDRGIGGLDGVKVIMTTALGNSKNVIGAFREGCESYIVKPIEKQKLLKEIENLGLISVKA